MRTSSESEEPPMWLFALIGAAAVYEWFQTFQRDPAGALTILGVAGVIVACVALLIKYNRGAPA